MEQGARGVSQKSGEGAGIVQNERTESLSRGWALAVGGAEWERHNGGSKRRHLFQKIGSQGCPKTRQKRPGDMAGIKYEG